MQCRGWLQYRGRRLLICIMQCRGLTMKVRHYWLWRLEAEHWGHRLNEYGGYRLKGSVSRDYLPQFLQMSNPSGPLINSLNSEVFSHSVSISPRSQSFLKIQISQRNRKRIWKCFSLFVGVLDGFESCTKIEVKNLVTHFLQYLGHRVACVGGAWTWREVALDLFRPEGSFATLHSLEGETYLSSLF